MLMVNGLCPYENERVLSAATRIWKGPSGALLTPLSFWQQLLTRRDWDLKAESFGDDYVYNINY